MNETPTDRKRDLLGRVLVPVANVDDAERTARILATYDPGEIVVLHVVEKGEGVPDKTPVEQSEEIAAESFAVVREHFPDAETETAYARDVVGAIIETAGAVEATSIVYRPRSGGRLMHFLSGDLSLKLLTRADRPVVSLPEA
ncbi:universal stress protein [Halodesulfurarchaeum sp. HSR-GB]|uniref:universal stress protein n=1 Tax=Halodesulfurarchaeum sp. HSR-GB TaxID=3074077 RepID=UPI00286560C7|nr:universal stress protein [Halodesulfurarchaeum sp. HSR-GB]MDR5656901.1 universal stress protein [Halodesulfurarchaeum sp. HSR-GB]